MGYFDENNILVDHQHGFRSRRSCETQLILTYQDLAQTTDKRGQVDMLVLDFAKAFDTVPHQRLLKKLAAYGVTGNLHKWIASFLIGWTQCVNVDGTTSETAPVRSGVPQGTVLGPLLFLVYINDLAGEVSSSVRLFADDCVMYRPVVSEAAQRALYVQCTYIVRALYQLYVQCTYIVRALYQLYVQCTYIVRTVPAGRL